MKSRPDVLGFCSVPTTVRQPASEIPAAAPLCANGARRGLSPLCIISIDGVHMPFENRRSSGSSAT
jgi:hypothetical protein